MSGYQPYLYLIVKKVANDCFIILIMAQGKLIEG